MVIAVYLAVILSTVGQTVTTKLFSRGSKNSLVFNAIKAAASFGMFALMAVFGFTFHLPTLIFGLFYGGCLCLSMYAGYKALSLGPMALTGMLVSFSVLIPLLWGVTVGDETLTALHTGAIFLLLGSIVLTNADKLQKRAEGKGNHWLWMFFVATTFLCNGICSILQKQHQTLYPEQYNREFMFFAMLLCLVLYSTVALCKHPLREIKATKGKRFGALSGLANGLASFFTLMLAGMENASILFPIISAGTTLCALLCGRIFFKEKMKINHYVALVLGILAVVLLKI